MAFGSGKKPANQGKPAPSAPTNAFHTSGVPSAAKPGASKILFGHRPEGIKGSKPGAK